MYSYCDTCVNCHVCQPSKRDPPKSGFVFDLSNDYILIGQEIVNLDGKFSFQPLHQDQHGALLEHPLRLQAGPPLRQAGGRVCTHPREVRLPAQKRPRAHALRPAPPRRLSCSTVICAQVPGPDSCHLREGGAIRHPYRGQEKVRALTTTNSPASPHSRRLAFTASTNLCRRRAFDPCAPLAVQIPDPDGSDGGPVRLRDPQAYFRAA
jgi:hypothetical protein